MGWSDMDRKLQAAMAAKAATASHTQTYVVTSSEPRG